jgi:hypothetical protein
MNWLTSIAKDGSGNMLLAGFGAVAFVATVWGVVKIYSILFDDSDDANDLG